MKRTVQHADKRSIFEVAILFAGWCFAVVLEVKVRPDIVVVVPCHRARDICHTQISGHRPVMALAGQLMVVR